MAEDSDNCELPSERQRMLAALGPRDIGSDGGHEYGLEPVGDRLVTYEEALSQHAVQGDNYKLEFDELVTCVIAPGCDIAKLIKKFAKVAFKAGEEYTLSSRIEITTPCYISGCGAKIKLLTEDAGFFFKSRYNSIPVVEMEKQTITDVVFNGMGLERTKPVVEANLPILLHNCVFIDADEMPAVKANMQATLRGCHFLGNKAAVWQEVNYTIKLNNCVFERNTIAIASRGSISLKNCCFVDNVCSVYVKENLDCETTTFSMMEKNNVPFQNRMCVCLAGIHVLPLAHLHVESNNQTGFPIFSHCNIIRCRLYIGSRNGLFTGDGCNFLYSTLLLEKTAARRISLIGAYDNGLVIRKVVSRTSDRNEHRACLWGGWHTSPVLQTSNVTSKLKVDRFLYSVDAPEFSDHEPE